MTIFLSTGVIISWLAESRKRADNWLRQRNEYLERWVAQREELEKQLEYRASHDYLTDLHNQASFYDHLARALSRARRRGSEVGLLFIDLDDFKLVNDFLGHQEADRVLQAVAVRLKGCLRESEIAARIGGDEFVVVLEDVTDSGTAVGVAERFQEQLRVPFQIHDRHRMRISASIGIAVGARGVPESWFAPRIWLSTKPRGWAKGAVRYSTRASRRATLSRKGIQYCGGCRYGEVLLRNP